jgi:hypothetical protein
MSHLLSDPKFGTMVCMTRHNAIAEVLGERLLSS